MRPSYLYSINIGYSTIGIYTHTFTICFIKHIYKLVEKVGCLINEPLFTSSRKKQPRDGEGRVHILYKIKTTLSTLKRLQFGLVVGSGAEVEVRIRVRLNLEVFVQTVYLY